MTGEPRRPGLLSGWFLPTLASAVCVGIIELTAGMHGLVPFVIHTMALLITGAVFAGYVTMRYQRHQAYGDGYRAGRAQIMSSIAEAKQRQMPFPTWVLTESERQFVDVMQGVPWEGGEHDGD